MQASVLRQNIGILSLSVVTLAKVFGAGHFETKLCKPDWRCNLDWNWRPWTRPSSPEPIRVRFLLLFRLFVSRLGRHLGNFPFILASFLATAARRGWRWNHLCVAVLNGGVDRSEQQISVLLFIISLCPWQSLSVLSQQWKVMKAQRSLLSNAGSKGAIQEQLTIDTDKCVLRSQRRSPKIASILPLRLKMTTRFGLVRWIWLVYFFLSCAEPTNYPSRLVKTL